MNEKRKRLIPRLLDVFVNCLHRLLDGMAVFLLFLVAYQ